MTKGPPESFSRSGWPGIRCAYISITYCFILGPGAILIGIFGHLKRFGRSVTADPEFGTGLIIVGRSAAVLIGMAFTYYFLNLTKHWFTKYSIIISPESIQYDKKTFGKSIWTVIEIASIAAVDPFIEIGADPKCNGYVRVILRNESDEEDDAVRLFAGSFTKADEIAKTIKRHIATGKV